MFGFGFGIGLASSGQWLGGGGGGVGLGPSRRNNGCAVVVLGYVRVFASEAMVGVGIYRVSPLPSFG